MDVVKLHNNSDEKKEKEVLPGFRFHPTDEELVGFYLRRKVEKKPLSIELIKQIDIYKYDPWDLPKTSAVGEKEWYFFCKRGRKYRNSIRPNRVTGSGFWKATGIDKPIYSVKEAHDEECIGLKKSLVYYRGSAGKGTKTDWMMHEFRLPPIAKTSNHNNSQAKGASDVQEAEVWTLCRIFKRIPPYKKYTPNLNKDSSSSIQQKERNHLFFGHLPNVSQITPTTLTSSNFWNQNNIVDNDAFVRNENWDDLRSVVQFANIGPSKVYDCK